MHKNIYTLAALLREKIVEGNYASQHCSARLVAGLQHYQRRSFISYVCPIAEQTKKSNNWGKRKIKTGGKR